MAIFIDCTLRDGSYVIKSNFTPKNVLQVYKNLSEAKVTMIEVGHGQGIGAHRNNRIHTKYDDKNLLKYLKTKKKKGGGGVLNGECFVSLT